MRAHTRGLEAGHYAALETPWQETFFFLPLGHSEDLSHQELAVQLAEVLVREAPEAQRTFLGRGSNGRRSIWACPAAIENTVNAHGEHQVAFLKGRDEEILTAVQSIRRDEEAHESHAIDSGGRSGKFFAVLRWVIGGATSFAIWLSTKL